MSLAVDFANLFLDDPIMAQLWTGTIRWGDIPGICDIKRSRSASIASIASIASDESVCSEESEPDITRICNSRAKKPAIAAPVTDREVPPYTPGIKTVIARNLPRDIRVDQLRCVFEKYGPIKDIYIPKNMDKSSPYFGTTKGFALIKFLKPTDSARAYQSEYARLTIGKNNITVEFAKEDR